MTNYIARFINPTEFAERAFTADTPEEALALAQAFYAEEPESLWSKSFDGELLINTIEVTEDGGPGYAFWQDDTLQLERAAGELFDALQGLVARNRAEAAASGFTDDEMTWLEEARRALAKAKSPA